MFGSGWVSKFTEEYVGFARRALEYFLREGYLRVHEFNCLLKDVLHHERRITICDRKATFVSFATAKRIVKSRREARDGHKRTFPYHCRDCGLYHIASSDSISDEKHRAEARFRAKRKEPIFDEDYADA